ncbi:thiamine diphosphate-binding protein [Russula compacta]|nr:thiamine diphosphate-binding protein [Russula compacta]
MSGEKSKFPIDLNQYEKDNIQLLRDAIILFTSNGAARGISGHTGQRSIPYDTVPELCILQFLGEASGKYYPIVFDEAGHRVATQYLLAALEAHTHPRRAPSIVSRSPLEAPGSSRAWSHSRHQILFRAPRTLVASDQWHCVAHRDKLILYLDSDGSQQEGNDAEAARLAVAQNLNVKITIDDNNVTIAGHPSEYLKGYDLHKTLAGHGVEVVTVEGEDIDALWAGFVKVITHQILRLVSASSLHVAVYRLYRHLKTVVSKRVMARGLPDTEGKVPGHDVISVKGALGYFKHRGYFGDKYTVIQSILSNIKPTLVPYLYAGSTREANANRVAFGEAVSAVLDGLSKDDAARKVMVIGSDLQGSTGLRVIHQKHPEVFIPSGVMERGNFSAAAGFGFDPDKFGVFSTFSAFLEMVVSEIAMARLNNSNVLCHFSHSGGACLVIDEIVDNTCHFGINSLFPDNGLDDVRSWLYLPADALQMHAVIKRVFFERGLRFIFFARTKVPYILKPNSDDKSFGNDYEFVPGNYDAVLRVRQEGLDVAIVNKPTLDLVDEQLHLCSYNRNIGSSPFVLVAESLNRKTGLGSRFGTWLLERQLTPKYKLFGYK